MKAILLAAGEGTRLKPLTDDTPKCLMPVCGQPMLYWWAKLFEKHGVDTVLINTHNFYDDIKNYIVKNLTSKIKWIITYEDKLLGSVGTLRDNRHFVNDSVIIAYADVLTNIDLSMLVWGHETSNKDITISVRWSDDVSQKGVLGFKDNNVAWYKEKPIKIKRGYENCGVYVMNKKVLTLPQTKKTLDIGTHILPNRLKDLHPYVLKDEYLIDMGTIESYARANKEWYDVIQAL